MLVDSRELPEGTVIDADLCVIGGGMAGITLVRELLDTGLRIAVLESGGEQPDQAYQDLYRGSGRISDSSGRGEEISNYLPSSRVRAFGGSGHVWGGKCGRLEPADFMERSWIPHSGWPFDREHLDPFYDRASALLKLPSFRGDVVGKDPARPPFAVGDGKEFTTVPRIHSPVTGGRSKSEFDGFRYAITKTPGVTVYLHANVTRIRATPDGRSVAGLEVRCLNGRAHTARARYYVLAAGGMENARILLLSEFEARSGLVGRFFSGHLNCGAYGEGQGPNSGVAFSDVRQSLDLYTTQDLSKTWGIWNLTTGAQSRHRLPNFWATFQALSYTPPPSETAVTAFARNIDATRGDGSAQFLPVRVMAENPPDPESRLTLQSETDGLGQRRLSLEWKLNDQYVRGLGESVALLGRALGGSGTGRLRWPLSREQLLPALGPARHHIGTTRMHRDSRQGVVDEHSRMHGVENFYVAGSSVFPTGGIANPTLTLLALTIRLADRMRQVLRR